MRTPAKLTPTQNPQPEQTPLTAFFSSACSDDFFFGGLRHDRDCRGRIGLGIDREALRQRPVCRNLFQTVPDATSNSPSAAPPSQQPPNIKEARKRLRDQDLELEPEQAADNNSNVRRRLF